MAAIKEASTLRNLEDITECCICCETFTDPRMLPCIHTFCFECLRKTGLEMKKRPGHVMPCPLCKEEFTIPRNGWDDLKKNFFMMRLMDITTAAKSSDQSTSILCSSCKTRNQAEASRHCVQCSKNLCLQCSNRHQKHNPSHQVRRCCTESKDAAAKSSATAFCKLHPKKPANLYCTDCSECVCTGCSVDSHKGHSCVNTDSASVEFRKEIESCIENVSDCMLKGSAKKVQMEQEKVKFLSEMKAIEKKVNRRGQELKALVQKHTEALLEELSSIKQKRLKQFETENGEVERHLTLSESFRQYCTEVSTNGSPGSICQLMSNLRTLSNEMRTLMESCTERKLSADQIFLTKTKLNVSTERGQKWNVIGEIKG